MIQPTDPGLIAGRVNPLFIEGRLSLPLIEATTARALGLQDGQVVQALVQPRGDQMGLLLRGRQIDAPPMPNWEIGQTVTLRVQANPSGLWTLHPVAAGPAAPVPPPSALDLQPAISRLGSLLFRPPGQADIQALFRPGVLDALLNVLPRPDLQDQWKAMRLSMAKLTPEAIQLALAGAVGSEVGLARGHGPVLEDPKQLLRKLLAALDQTDGDSEDSMSTTRKITGAIDDLESAQVHAVQSQSQGEMMFSLVLPFKDAEPVELEFQRRKSTNGEQILTVNVHSRSREFGELWLKTELHGQTGVELVMWAVQEDVARQARQRAPALGQELQAAGLSMRSFQAIHGARSAAPAEWAPSGSGLILDLRA